MTTISPRPALLLLLVLTACAAPRGGAAPFAGGPPVLRPCPDWSRSSREDFSNRTASNFGCADAVNFHAQLADPRDAERGQSGGAGGGAGAAAAIDRMHQRVPPPPPGGAAPAAASAPKAPGA